MSRSALASCLGAFLLGACGTAGPPAAFPAPPAPAATVSYQSGLQYNGAIGVVQAGSVARNGYEISAPIEPRLEFIYGHEASNFPATHAEEEKLVHSAALTFDFLLTSCQPSHPAITLADPMGPPLTRAQVNTNFDEVAKCAYEMYGSKPAWIPMMINDVGICENELGPEWHLISEADLLGFTDADYKFFADTLVHDPSTIYNLFQLDIYVRGLDGRLKFGTLTAGAAAGLMDVSDTILNDKVAWTPNMPRCIRRLHS